MATSSAPAANRDPLAEQAVINEYQGRRARLQEAFSKGQEISAEIAEHEVVLKTLEPMEKSRKCFRLVGDVMVERTVGEVAPAISSHKDKLIEVMKTMEGQVKMQEEELAAFVKKHNIRIIREGEEEGNNNGEEEEEGEVSKGGGGGAPQGVLVPK